MKTKAIALFWWALPLAALNAQIRVGPYLQTGISQFHLEYDAAQVYEAQPGFSWQAGASAEVGWGSFWKIQTGIGLAQRQLSLGYNAAVYYVDWQGISNPMDIGEAMEPDLRFQSLVLPLAAKFEYPIANWSVHAIAGFSFEYFLKGESRNLKVIHYHMIPPEYIPELSYLKEPAPQALRFGEERLDDFTQWAPSWVLGLGVDFYNAEYDRKLTLGLSFQRGLRSIVNANNDQSTVFLGHPARLQGLTLHAQYLFELE